MSGRGKVSRDRGTCLSCSKSLCVGISLLLSVQSCLWGQSTNQISLTVVAGEGVINNVGQRGVRDPIVRVEDASQKPVSGAVVVFTLPTEGSSGEFAGGSKTTIITTDARGEAIATGLKVNRVPGKLPIHVTATWKGETVRTNIMQFSMEVPGKHPAGSSKKALILLAILGAAAAGGVSAAVLNKKSPASPAPIPPSVPITITPTPGTVGPPH